VLVAAINAIADAAPAKPYVMREETVSGKPAPYVTTFYPELDMRNFVAEVQFFKPADVKIHPWDLGGFFRAGRPDQYRLVIQSARIWHLMLIDTALADAVDGKVSTQGIVANLNVDTDGSNTFHLVVKDKQAFLFVNNQYIGTMDASARTVSGAFYIGTGMVEGANFPGLQLHFKNLIVKWLE